MYALTLKFERDSILYTLPDDISDARRVGNIARKSDE